MKKFIASLFVLFIVNGYSQITITTNDMPDANDTVRLSNTVDSWGIDPTLTGANYLWDYSFLEPLTQQIDTFFTVASTPFAYQFYFNNQILYPAHKASYARPGMEFDLFGMITMTDVFNYFKNESSRYSEVGFGSNINGIPASTRNIPIDTIYKFPLNFSDNYTSHSEWLLNIPNLAAYGQSKDRLADVEGWGTLMTPFGTFQTLKVKMEIDITDTLNIDSLGINFSFPRPTTTEYHWLAPGMKIPVLQINTVAGIITTIQYQDSIRYNLLATNEIDLLQPLIYPNPAIDEIIVNTDGKAKIEKIEVYDINGKLLLVQSGFNLPLAKLNVAGLPNGTYILSITSSKGIHQSKITIAR